MADTSSDPNESQIPKLDVSDSSNIDAQPANETASAFLDAVDHTNETVNETAYEDAVEDLPSEVQANSVVSGDLPATVDEPEPPSESNVDASEPEQTSQAAAATDVMDDIDQFCNDIPAAKTVNIEPENAAVDAGENEACVIAPDDSSDKQPEEEETRPEQSVTEEADVQPTITVEPESTALDVPDTTAEPVAMDTAEIVAEAIQNAIRNSGPPPNDIAQEVSAAEENSSKVTSERDGANEEAMETMSEPVLGKLISIVPTEEEGEDVAMAEPEGAEDVPANDATENELLAETSAVPDRVADETDAAPVDGDSVQVAEDSSIDATQTSTDIVTAATDSTETAPTASTDDVPSSTDSAQPDTATETPASTDTAAPDTTPAETDSTAQEKAASPAAGEPAASTDPTPDANGSAPADGNAAASSTPKQDSTDSTTTLASPEDTTKSDTAKDGKTESEKDTPAEVKKEPTDNASDQQAKPSKETTPHKKDEKSEKKNKPKQACVVCSKVTKCKYNIVRNGDIKHLCDDNCFKVFRANPTQFLKRKDQAQSSPASAPAPAPIAAPTAKAADARSCDNCKKLQPEGGMLHLGRRRLCCERCLAIYKSERCCYQCHRDLLGLVVFAHINVPNVGSRRLCSQLCKTKYEGLNADKSKKVSTTESNATDDDEVQIVSANIPSYRTHGGRNQATRAARNFKCAVCNKLQQVKHEVSLDGRMHKLCSDSCFASFRVVNKLSLQDCAQCNAHMMTVEGQIGHSLQSEGKTFTFCSATCNNNYKMKHAALVPCTWCHIKRNKFTMVENQDKNTGKYALFCTLNCLSLYRVNMQATSNSSVKCDNCRKMAPAQYHLTMSDASVRNFCSYSCVMAFQGRFSRPGGATSPGATQPTPQQQQPNTAAGGVGRGGRRASNRVAAKTGPVSSPVASGTEVNMPLISNVYSLAPNNQAATPKGRPPLQQSPAPSQGVSPPMPSLPTQAAATQVTQQIIVQPPTPKTVKNKALLCKPLVQTKATSCKPHTQTKSCQTDDLEEKKTTILVPVPVPIYVPVPMGMYNFPVPYPVPMPIPLPMPCFIPTTKKNGPKILKHMKEIQERTPADPFEAELLMMAEAVAREKSDSSDSDTEEYGEDPVAATPEPSSSAPHAPESASTPAAPSASAGSDLGEDMLQMALRMASEMKDEPVLDLETSLNPTPINPGPPSVSAPSMDNSSDVVSRETSPSPPPAPSRRGRKRRGTSSGNRGRPKRSRSEQADPEETEDHESRTAASPPPPPALPLAPPVAPGPPAPPADANCMLKFTYGVNAFRHWTMQKNTAVEKAASAESGSTRKKPKMFKSDLLACTADELNFALKLFVKQVRKPNGETYAPDSIFYLCLGIQQYLFENNRIDNIFTDIYFEQFTDQLNEVLHNYEVRLNQQGLIVCRIEEEHLWEAKQLGAHSPHVLLNTLIYFNTKYFMLKTPEEHLNLSFSHIMKHWKKTNPTGKQSTPGRSVYLRYYAVSDSSNKRGKQKEDAPAYEQAENLDNPLRCPVKLYEFFLSKCPESIKNRNDVFYLVPELSCVPDSPVWYSTASLGIEPMTKMLNRVRVVKEIQEAHLHHQPPYLM